MSKMSKRVRHIPTIYWLIGITILGMGLRLYRLGAQSLWMDEAFRPNTICTNTHKPMIYLLSYGYLFPNFFRVISRCQTFLL